jgi:diguanylate cyclase (GGDEF)-like protein
MLTKAGYEVTLAGNGREALALFLKRFHPIVLTDWMMPEMDGLQFCRAIRESEPAGYVFIVILTAKDGKEDIITGLEAGADDYLTKPFENTELLARLNTAKRVLNLETSLKTAYEEIKKLSITDALTGCYNRGYLMDRLPQELKRSKRYKHPLSLIMCDVDHFKKINDTYGHPAGDSVLKVLSRRIKDSIREDVDWLARYGGEEFLILLPETPLEGAFQVVIRIQSFLKEKLLDIDGEEIRITSSFGISALGPENWEEEIQPEALIADADKYLYQAKQDGRDNAKGGMFSSQG